MLPGMLDNTTLPVLEKAVNFAQARHGVLAGNIANIDTPGYKTRDLSPQLFQESLRNAIDSRNTSANSYSSSSTSNSQGKQEIDHFRKVDESTKHLLYHDQSDVSLESQVTELAKNQGMHNMAISLMTQQFRLLEAAVTERVA